MKPFAIATLGATLLLSANAAAQTVMEHSQALKPVIAPAQIIGPDKPQQASRDTLSAALARTGKFNTFLALWQAAGMDDWERKAGWDGDGKAGFCDGSVRGFCDGSVRGVTVLAPDDAAFAKMDKAKLVTLQKDPAAARAFVLAHVVGQPLKVVDMFYADNPTSEKLFKGAGGDEFKLLCDGRAHVGLHHPRINGGIARVGDVQDVPFSGGMVQEIDGVLAH
jgi:hypothetical protein